MIGDPKAENKALRDAAAALISGLEEHLDSRRDVVACEARHEGDECEVIATRRLDGPDGEGEADLCESCADERIVEGWTEIDEFPYAAPLQKLRDMIRLRKVPEAP